VHTDENYELTSALMADLSGKDDTSELLTVVGMRDDDFSKVKLSANPMLALFDRPSNKGNLGTVIRSCDAMGIDALIIAGHAVDLYDPDVISSSMGSFFKVPVIRITDNSQADDIFRHMKESYSGFRIVGTTAHKQTAISDVDLTAPVAFLIGNETDGLSAYFESIADEMATISMSLESSASSINVSCAATVLFYEANRQRAK
jgi:TrmH family RNA methyltransferase